MVGDDGDGGHGKRNEVGDDRVELKDMKIEKEKVTKGDMTARRQDRGVCIEESLLRDERRQLQRCNHDVQKVNGQIVTHGFISSINGTQREKPGICLEVNLGHDQFISQLNGLGLCRSDLKSTSQANEDRRLRQRGTWPSKGTQKTVVVRATAKVLSRSFSEKLPFICEDGRLKEAHETLQLVGVFGVWFGTEVSDHGSGVGSGCVRVRRWVCSTIGVEKWSWQRVLAWKWVSALGVFRCIECSVGVQMSGVVGSSSWQCELKEVAGMELKDGFIGQEVGVPV
ncbi:hypothetical protein LOK49_LG01G01470 [Camellia lanceoleosa]|uniref:Uncharacterized protein n=1 Tax=Camellia lanceoleosa TaxID=1840588 RepID=A0ACC0IXU6_9ERIC|nr:hypothetical protein LOK49_LG01G01470 [Camellia lanceoleosa]